MPMHRSAPLLLAAALLLTSCTAPTTAPAETAATPTATEASPVCLTVPDAQATAISEGVEDGITLTGWTALPAETGPGAWFLAAKANGPGIEDEPFVFFTAGNPESFTGGQVMAADNITAEFVDWPMQEGAMLDDAYEDVKDCSS